MMECSLRVGGEILPQDKNSMILRIENKGLKMEGRMKLEIRAQVKMSVLWRVSGLSLRDEVRSLCIRQELGVEPLIVQSNNRKELAEVVQACEDASGITYPIWPWDLPGGA